VILSAHQPQYLPYLGYFDKVARADVFVLLDQPQFEKEDWQNRNRIKAAQGPQWLTVPVLTKGQSTQSIKHVGINPREDWRRKHWMSLELNYKKAPFWEPYAARLKGVYERPWDSLCELNLELYRLLAALLDVQTSVKIESGLDCPGTGTERLIQLCRSCGADTYLSGAGGKGYMDEALFEQAGIRLLYQHYEHPVYRQQHMKQGFVPYLSVLDLLLNEGPASLTILRNQPT
jgi:hypothetical protein